MMYFTVMTNHDLRMPGVPIDMGFVCKEKNRLIEEYEAATRRLSQAIERCGGVIGTAGVEPDELQRIADDARRICRELQAALQTHRLLHGC